MGFGDLNKIYSNVVVFTGTSHDRISWRSMALALGVVFVVSRVVKYYNAKRVSGLWFCLDYRQ
jgi:hypothetical protein